MSTTIVYQSYRTHDVPGWIAACMDSVRGWAQAKGYEYLFIDDALFERVPSWFRDKAAGEVCPVTDIARLVVARELLKQGYERTVWLDADMLVFAPEWLDVEIKSGFRFCLELWADRGPQGPRIRRRVNNSVTVFHRRNVHLEFLIDAGLRIAASQPRIGKLDVGTAFLSRLHQVIPFPLLQNVGMFSPAMVLDIGEGREDLLRAYAAAQRQPLACANLCASLADRVAGPEASPGQILQTVVDALGRDRGSVINRFIDPGAQIH